MSGNSGTATKRKSKMAYAVLAEAYSSKAAAQLNINGDKIFLSIANSIGERKFDWEKKRVFAFERHELYVIREAMRLALESVKAAQDFCAQMLSSAKYRNAMFVHRYGEKTTQGGVMFNPTEDPSVPIMKFVISHGEKDQFSCHLTRPVAYQIVQDLDLYLKESLRPMIQKQTEFAMERRNTQPSSDKNGHQDNSDNSSSSEFSDIAPF